MPGGMQAFVNWRRDYPKTRGHPEGTIVILVLPVLKLHLRAGGH